MTDLRDIHRQTVLLTRWARMASRLGDMKRSQLLRTGTLADDTGESMEGASGILEAFERRGWVECVLLTPHGSVSTMHGTPHWKPTAKLPPVAALDDPDAAVVGALMSAALTLNVRGIGA